MRDKVVVPVRAAWALALPLGLSACANAPAIPVLGAYFPDWLFCITGGLLLSLLLHALLSRRGASAPLAPAVLTYPMFTAMFSLIAWLLFFRT
ncbi:YtcA family lipoprotein [Pseudomonas citronellolis]|uniref:YtcA family lipoprotein n=1 Tax=Pseudomonas citronellolis TaxID=53408 RepID=UPI0023E35DE1|nr:YtcA family lipoprotein [Pseudomonas citronellolis]MDF3931664.1 YtcA family lipoprotein [Pseudomonas citronellolis]